VEENDIDLKEDTKKWLSNMTPKFNMTMAQWEADFETRRKEATEELSEMLNRPVNPYPVTALLEKILAIADFSPGFENNFERDENVM